MPAGDYSISIDPVSIIAVCAFAAVVLILAILAVVLLFKQKSLLAQISDSLRQGAPAPGYAPPVPNTCPKCGAMHAPEAGFCQNCGAAL